MSGVTVAGMQSTEAGKNRDKQLSDRSTPLDMEHLFDILFALFTVFCCTSALFFCFWTFHIMKISAALNEEPSSRSATNAGDNQTEIDTCDVYFVGSTTTAV